MSRILSKAACELVDDAGPAARWLVMVHGAGQDRRLFDRQVVDFRAAYRLCLVDLPGHGLAKDHPGPFGLPDHADAIAAALDTAGIARCHYWGTHTAAGAGLLLAARQPQRFLSLILEGPVLPGHAMPAVTEQIQRVAETLRRDGIVAARRQWWSEGGWFAAMRAEPERTRAAGQLAMLDDFDGRPWLGGGPLARPVPPVDDALRVLEVPTLIVNGAADMSAFLDAAATLDALLPTSRRLSIPGAGGFPLWEAPDAVNAAVREFLALA